MMNVRLVHLFALGLLCAMAPVARGDNNLTGVTTASLPYAPGKAPRLWSVATAETIMARYPDYGEAYFKPWTYVHGYVLYGFEMLYRATGDKKYFEYLQADAQRQGGSGRFSVGDGDCGKGGPGKIGKI